jgi:hypothetical protein
MGLEPTTPCLQSRFRRIRTDVDGQKVLVSDVGMTAEDGRGRPRMFPKSSLGSKARARSCRLRNPPWSPTTGPPGRSRRAEPVCRPSTPRAQRPTGAQSSSPNRSTTLLAARPETSTQTAAASWQSGSGPRGPRRRRRATRRRCGPPREDGWSGVYTGESGSTWVADLPIRVLEVSRGRTANRYCCWRAEGFLGAKRVAV